MTTANESRRHNPKAPAKKSRTITPTAEPKVEPVEHAEEHLLDPERFDDGINSLAKIGVTENGLEPIEIGQRGVEDADGLVTDFGVYYEDENDCKCVKFEDLIAISPDEIKFSTGEATGNTSKFANIYLNRILPGKWKRAPVYLTINESRIRHNFKVQGFKDKWQRERFNFPVLMGISADATYNCKALEKFVADNASYGNGSIDVKSMYALTENKHPEADGAFANILFLQWPQFKGKLESVVVDIEGESYKMMPDDYNKYCQDKWVDVTFEAGLWARDSENDSVTVGWTLTLRHLNIRYKEGQKRLTISLGKAKG
jgi:hypothetical protein